MSDQPRIERFLEHAARMASGAGIHPIEVLQRIQAAAEASVREGAIANAYRVECPGAEIERIARMSDQLARGASRMLDELAKGGTFASSARGNSSSCRARARSRARSGSPPRIAIQPTAPGRLPPAPPA